MTTPTTRQWPGLFFDAGGGAVFNVKHPDFGAQGNGTTDDYAAIRAAIIAAEAESKPHGDMSLPKQNRYATIVFPPGNYVLTHLRQYPFRNIDITGTCVTVVGFYHYTPAWPGPVSRT